MIIYFLIFSILSYLAYEEIHNPKPLDLKSYIFLILLFSVFIGLKKEIGCDWVAYNDIFNLSNCATNTGDIDLCNKFKISSTYEYLNFKEIGFSSINSNY